MAADETSISNLALAKLGISPIMALTDDSKAAQFASRFYEQTRDEVLQAHRWNFAIARAELNQLSVRPPFEWSYAYQLPSDCLRVLQCNGYGLHERQDYWTVEQSRLLSNSSTAQLRYISRVTDGTFYHPLFVEALACKLASKLATPLSGSNTVAAALLEEYLLVTGPRARITDAFENSPRSKMPWVNSPLVMSRYVGG
jgi:hypothetical protein